MITGTWEKKNLSDAWTGFARFILLSERPPEGYTWSGERLTRKQTTSRPDNVWPDIWKHMSDAAKKKATQRWAIEKPKLDNARQLRGTFFIEPNDEEFKLTMKARSWKVGSSDASSNALQNTDKEQWRNPPQYWETRDKVRLCCRCRRMHETKARRSWTQSISHYCKRGRILKLMKVLRTNSFRSLKNYKNSRCKGGRNEKNWRKFRHGS